MNKLIGITGRAGAGKDTLATHLVANYNFKTISFAQPIRDALSAMMGITKEQFQHPLKEAVIPAIGKSPRQMMQTLGTEWGRQLVNPDLWLILAEQKMRQYWDAGYNVAITDVRFENEAALVRRLGGVIVRVVRNDDDSMTQHTSHASEAGITPVPGDRILFNNGEISDLFTQFDEVFDV